MRQRGSSAGLLVVPAFVFIVAAAESLGLAACLVIGPTLAVLVDHRLRRSR